MKVLPLIIFGVATITVLPKYQNDGTIQVILKTGNERKEKRQKDKKIINK
jgi:hypothetical protein